MPFLNHSIVYMLLPRKIPLDRDGQYCMDCFSPQVQRIFRDKLTFYQCASCGKILERSLVIDEKVTWWIDTDALYWHESVGVLVVAENKLLVMFRQIFPFSFTIPAGHLDKGEIPIAAAKRELEEETGIVVSELAVVKENFDMVGDSCRRGSDHHRWNLYRIKLDMIPNVVLGDEASEIKWLTFQELKNESRLTFPLRFFVNTFGQEIFG